MAGSANGGNGGNNNGELFGQTMNRPCGNGGNGGKVTDGVANGGNGGDGNAGHKLFLGNSDCMF